MYKVALISYHKNAETIYPHDWITEHRESIISQTYKDFDILELEYGGGKYRVFGSSIYESKELPTFIHAMNYLIGKALKMGYDCIGNLNLDDVYSPHRLGVQMQYVRNNYDLVSSNFSLMKDDVIFHEHHFENLDIKRELEKNHNPICHPVILCNRKYWETNKYVPEEVPYEDLLLWKRTIDNYRFIIAPENLLTQRIHNNSVCKSNNR